MAPIRVAIIGLSKSAITSWAAEGHLPYLLSERGRQRYQITALLNSSEAAAQRSIEHYKLGSNVKAYGSPQDLAADPDVDLVVCTTRVDVHYPTIKPSIEAGKNAFVEWPLAENVHRASELATLTKEKGVRTLVAVQARVAPSVLKLKELIASGKIGKVVSSDVIAYTPHGGGFSISEGLAYFFDKKVGGNPITIAFAHMIDFVHSVLGEYESSHSHLQIQRPNQSIVSAETGAKTPATTDVPDLVSVHGTLKSSEHVTEGATLVVYFKTGAPFPGTNRFVWTITGEKGELRMSSERGPFIQSESSASGIPIELHEYDSEEVEQVSWEWEEWREALSPRGREIGKLYDLYYEGRINEYGAADFDSAVIRHAQIDAMLWK